MARAHYIQSVTDPSGNIITNGSATIIDPATGRLLAQPLFLDDFSSTQISNPLTISSGVVEFFLDSPERVLIRIDAPNFDSHQYVADVFPPADQMVLADHPVRFSGSPDDGKLVTVASDGSLTFSAAPVGLTAQTTVNAFTLASGSVPVEWTIGHAGTGVTTSYNGAVISDTVSTFTKVFQVLGAGLGTRTTDDLILSITWSATLTDVGTLSLYKKLAGNSAFVIKVDGTTVYTTSTTDSGYVQVVVNAIAPGSHTFVLEYHLTGAATSAEELRLGGITLTAGGVISPHYHDGSGFQTLALGQHSTANFPNGTAVGDLSVAGANDTTAIGYSATANGTQSVAVGSGAAANNPGSIAIGQGSQARGDNSLAAGPAALSTAAGAVAFGGSTSATGTGNVAIGYQAVASGGAQAVAIGMAATAGAPNSIAIGTHASVAAPHSNSVALGSAVATTDSNQIVVGDATYTIFMKGAFRALGNVTLGSSTSKIGFFGSIGTTRPTVTGSRANNAAVGSLITALASLGLIVDGTTA